MWIDSTLYLFMLLIRCLFFFATLFVTHIIIADAAVMGALAYVMPEVLSMGLPDGVRIAIGIAVFIMVLILTKWKITFAAITLLCSYMWAWVALQLFSWETREHPVLTAFIMFVNISLHVACRQKMFGLAED